MVLGACVVVYNKQSNTSVTLLHWQDFRLKLFVEGIINWFIIRPAGSDVQDNAGKG